MIRDFLKRHWRPLLLGAFVSLTSAALIVYPPAGLSILTVYAIGCMCFLLGILGAGIAIKLRESAYQEESAAPDAEEKQELMVFNFKSIFFSPPQRDLSQALREYTQNCHREGAEVEEINIAMVACGSEMEISTREMQKQMQEQIDGHGEQKFFQEPSNDASPEETAEIIRSNQQKNQLIAMLENYPKLPEQNNLTINDVDLVSEARREHHLEVMGLAALCLEGYYSNLSQSRALGLRGG